VANECSIVVQVSGKVRDTITAPMDAPQSDVEKLARSSERVQRFFDGSSPKKVIYVPNRLINFVI
jgi:leucyl-tRNA synthetase